MDKVLELLMKKLKEKEFIIGLIMLIVCISFIIGFNNNKEMWHWNAYRISESEMHRLIGYSSAIVSSVIFILISILLMVNKMILLRVLSVLALVIFILVSIFLNIAIDLGEYYYKLHVIVGMIAMTVSTFVVVKLKKQNNK